MGGEQLGRDDVGDRSVQIGWHPGLFARAVSEAGRHADGVAGRGAIGPVGENESLRSEAGELGQHGFHDRPGGAGRGEDKGGETVLHHGDGPVQQVSLGKAFGDDVAGLHQLERPFEGIRVIEPAPDDDGVLHEAVAFGAGGDLLFDAERLARLLGKAAASNIIVGRTYDAGGTVVFDDGDEVVLEGDDGLPRELLVGDHSGAFGEYTRPLVEFAKEYARVVNDRAPYLPDPRTFAEIYLAAFREWFLHIQGDYRKRRRAFDNLFNHCRYDPGGSFAFRWEGVLRRLDQTNVDELVEAIRKRITVLGAKREA